MKRKTNGYLTQYMKEWIYHQNKMLDELNQMKFNAIHMINYQDKGIMINFYYSESGDNYTSLNRGKKFLSNEDFKYFKLKQLLSDID